MKKLYLVSFFVLSVFCNLNAQAPSKFNYQAVARDNANNPIANKFISIRSSILNNSPSGTEIYKEVFLLSTNEFGHFNLPIGAGNPVNGTFNTINWDQDDKYLKIELDITGGTNYILMGATQLLSVPYALNAKFTSSLSSSAKINLDQINGNTATNGQLLIWNGTKWTPTSPNLLQGDNWGIQSVQTSSVLSGTGTTASKLTLAQQGASVGQVLQWNGTTWIPETIAGGTDNWGTQTALTSGAITGNGTTGNPINLSQQGATANQVLKWNGSAWTPANETGSDNWGTQSALTSGALAGNGTTGNPILLSQQGATLGQILKWNGITWIPANDSLGSDNWGTQTASTSGALTGNGTTTNPILLSQQGATTGQVLKWNGTTWIPRNDSLGSDNWGTQSTVTNSTLTGSGISSAPLGLAPQGATTGQVLRWNGSAWVPSTLSGSGPGDDWGIQSVVNNGSLIGIGTIGSKLGVDSIWMAKKINQSPVKDSIVSLINASSTSTTASNGLTKTGNNLALGGSLIGATTITTSASNSLAVNGLQSGSVIESIVVSDAATGVLKRISPARIAGSTYTSSNGLSLSGTNFSIGGPLTSATSISTSINNTFALSGLQSGTIADSILVSDAATGIIKRISSTRIPSGSSGLVSANNGLSTSGSNVSLGGALTSATTINTTGANTIALSGIQSGTITDSLLVSDPVSGVIKRISASRLPSGSGGSYTASNGLVLTGSNFSLGGTMTTPVTITTSQINNIALTGLWTGFDNDSILTSNAANGIINRQSRDRVNYWKKDAFGNINFTTNKVSIGTNIAKNLFHIFQNTSIPDTTASIITTSNSSGGSISFLVNNTNTTISSGIAINASSGFIGIRGIAQGIANSALGQHIGVNGVATGNTLGTTIGVNGFADSSNFSVGVRGTGSSIGV